MRCLFELPSIAGQMNETVTFRESRWANVVQRDASIVRDFSSCN